MTVKKYAPSGMLALAPRAFGLLFEAPLRRAIEHDGDTAIVSITGPLMGRDDLFFDSYDAIKARVAAALEERPKALVLRIDSPGGLMSGCVETSRAIRKMASDAGVQLFAFVDGQATSAAYALATAADEIVVPTTGAVGSIGVIDAMVDASGADAAAGVHTTIIASGNRKADGSPFDKADGRTVAVAQERVDQLAEVFFQLVAEHRPQLTVDRIRGFEAATFFGAQARANGLADRVATFDDLLASIASESAARAAGGADMSATEHEEDNRDKARKALQAILDDEDADEKSKSRASKALKALDDDDDDDKQESKATDDKQESKATGDEDETKAHALAGVQALAELRELKAQLAAKEEASERQALLASRPDFAHDLVDILKDAPLATVRNAVKRIPRAARNPAAASATVAATRGEGQMDGGAPSRLPPEQATLMDRAMGLLAERPGVKREGVRLILGAPVPVTEGSN